MAGAIGIFVALIAAAAAAYVYFVVLAPDASKKKEADSAQMDAKEAEAKAEAEAEAKKKAQSQKKKQPAKAKKTPRVSKPTSHPRYVRRFGGHHGNILSMCPSPNGEWMATSGADGLLRVARVERDARGGADVYLHTKIEDDDGVPDKVQALSWEADDRTVACSLDRTAEVRFYRMRKKKDADPGDAHPYELAELVKRRFRTSSKIGDVTACVADASCASNNLVLTSGDSRAHGGQKTAVAWDGKTGHCLIELTTGGGDVQISRDGKFLCGRSAGKTDQVKLFQVVRKKVKGDIEPHFDRIAPGKVMTLVAHTKVMDVAFGYDAEGTCDKAFVCGTGGTVQVWNLNVEYRCREDPKLLCSMEVGNKISMVSSSLVGDRTAVITVDGMLHILKYASTPVPSISVVCSIQCFHSDGVGDVQFCPSGKQVYTRGKSSKDVFAWSAA
mmetsp:Transcript_32116/g.96235  ORF Transcript_32116/g.96235 Transcript_32116/m.96235 type:complete len:443 (-) Transcript_32116:416-1744(-)|eukprot:CAMPEP_0113545444 /NCGR_PEP_ID=MMETSP0015_2-20120614/11264_1 /TAXON_ID=2838 /ORGANISM="Odontella" /LENGTH=442 /DNA_ID=CAMNT_0000445809 /DNA_START=78 /DNA_END=1406 /DNA_ORIENTATION=+ /assembly_acc=CAM_ASM_000160